MKQSLLITILVLLLFASNALGNDTTSLYKARLEQLHQLSQWLKTKPNFEFSPAALGTNTLDTNSVAWRTYDTAFALFYDRHLMDSMFAVNTNVFAPLAKFQLLKLFLSSYDNLLDIVPNDSMVFKAPLPLNTSKVQVQEMDSESEAIISLYFLIDGKEYEIFGFSFAPDKAKLTGMTEVGGDQATYNIVRNYIERLRARKGK